MFYKSASSGFPYFNEYYPVLPSQIKLADKQAAVEKLQWEAKTSNQKAERLQDELDSTQSQISSLMHIFEGLSNDDAVSPSEDYDTTPDYAVHLPDIVSLRFPSSTFILFLC